MSHFWEIEREIELLILNVQRWKLKSEDFFNTDESMHKLGWRWVNVDGHNFKECRTHLISNPKSYKKSNNWPEFERICESRLIFKWMGCAALVWGFLVVSHESLLLVLLFFCGKSKKLSKEGTQDEAIMQVGKILIPQPVPKITDYVIQDP
jgi:hypothetical protein